MSITTPQLHIVNRPIEIFPLNGRSQNLDAMEYNKPAERISSIDMPMFDISTTVAVSSDQEIVSARRQGRALAELMGFSASDATLIATTISELARNIVHYAKSGKILLGKINGGEKAGIVVIAQDPGPGISDMQLAVRDGYSTSGGLGLGLPGVKRIMDVFEIVSRLGSGTTVTTIKWKR